MGFNVDALPQYVEQNATDLLLKSSLGSKSAKLFTLQTGVNAPTALNLMETDVNFQDGSDCGFNPDGETKLSQRVITPAILKVDKEYCDKKLLGTYKTHEVRVAAGSEKLPFEEKIMEDVSNGIAEKIETMIWQGQKGQDDEFEGVISILADASGSTINVTKAKGTAAYEAIKAVYMAAPAKIAGKGDFKLIVSEALFRQFIQELVAANMYHVNANDAEGEYTLPGTAVKVIGVAGLNDTADAEYIFGARLSNLFIGVDQEGDSDNFDVWYSKDNRTTRMQVVFAEGVQVAYPEEIVVGKIAK